jgi:hypothetical protein
VFQNNLVPLVIAPQNETANISFFKIFNLKKVDGKRVQPN